MKSQPLTSHCVPWHGVHTEHTHNDNERMNPFPRRGGWHLYLLSYLAGHFFFLSHCVAQAGFELLSTTDLPDSSEVGNLCKCPSPWPFTNILYLVFHFWASINTLLFEVCHLREIPTVLCKFSGS